MKVTVLYVACVIATVVHISAANADGWYLSLYGAYTLPSDVDTVAERANGDPVASFDFENGFGVLAAVGYDFNPARLELEGSFRNNDIDSLGKTNEDLNFARLDAQGDADVVGLFVNGYYDLHTESRFTPYLGAGAGLAFVSANDVREVGRTSFVDDGELAPGLQAMAGVAYALSESLDITVGYRFLYLGDLSGTLTRVRAPGDAQISLEDVQIHHLEAGFRYKF